MRRRKFVFWLGLGLFNLGEKLRADGFDSLAARLMQASEPSAPTNPPVPPEHWTAGEDNTWRWFEREHLIDGKWKSTGITTPVNKQTGKPYTGKTGYLDESLVPDALRSGDEPQPDDVSPATPVEEDAGKPSTRRRARHGRPPSRWLRQLRADELRIWLKTIDVPEAGVEGMTYWEHLTRDHYFDAARITGLTEDEQAKLHAAAHHGY